MCCGYVPEGTHAVTACSSMVERLLYTEDVAGSSPARPTQCEREENTMKSDSRAHEVEGIDKGERLELMALNADEFILTVLEPEAYGDERQAASIALNREQMRELASLTGTVLINTMEVNHNG